MSKRRPKRKPTRQVAEIVTPERWRHGDVVREVRAAEGGKAGGVIAARERAPLVIDRLFLDGHLGRDEKQARIRLAAGQWLHALWPKTGLAHRLSGTYEKIGDPSEGQSEAQLWNEGCYHDAMKAMGSYGGTVSKVCCDNVMVINPNALLYLRSGLDLLAKHRGIT